MDRYLSEVDPSNLQSLNDSKKMLSNLELYRLILASYTYRKQLSMDVCNKLLGHFVSRNIIYDNPNGVLP